MSEILCVYYSRTGHTRASMEHLAEKLDAEIVPLSDGVSRKGIGGYLRSGMDAMRLTCKPVRPVRTARPLHEYPLIIVGTPVWAGRCSVVVRSFLQEYGKEIQRAAWLITRGSDNRYESVFKQMDRYVSARHCAAISLHSGDVGQEFWEEEFIRDIKLISFTGHSAPAED